jgi:hypothetical protein
LGSPRSALDFGQNRLLISKFGELFILGTTAPSVRAPGVYVMKAIFRENVWPSDAVSGLKEVRTIVRNLKEKGQPRARVLEVNSRRSDLVIGDEKATAFVLFELTDGVFLSFE